MRIAVSGANGFIGQHVIHELQSREVDVVVISRSPEWPISQSTVITSIRMDVSHPPRSPFDVMGRPDALIHLAWDGLPNYQSSHHVETELPSQLAFLTSCIESGLKKLIVAGTCYEYGLATGELTEDIPTRPCTQYGLAKDLLRKALFNLRMEHEIDLAWLRLFYLYGKGQAKQSLYHALNSAIESGAMTFDMSGGEQLRDFLPVQEAARLIVAVARKDGADGVFNVCSGEPVAVKDIVQSWLDASNSLIELNLGKIPYSVNEPMAFWGSRRKLDALLDTSGLRDKAN